MLAPRLSRKAKVLFDRTLGAGLNDKMCVWLRRVVGLDVAFLDAD